MAKDPATLWYWNDWNGGTMTFTRHLKGCYMDILSAQFNSGPLSLEEIKTVLGSDFGPSWPTIQKKFKQSETGLFFNERMEAEKNKRKKHSEKQSESANKRWKKGDNDASAYANAYAKTMPLENENENKDVLLKKEGVEENLLIPEMLQIWILSFKNYASLVSTDYPALFEIAKMICESDGIKNFQIEHAETKTINHIKTRWGELAEFAKSDQHFSRFSLCQLSKPGNFQSLSNAKNNKNGFNNGNNKNNYKPTFTDQVKANAEYFNGLGTVGDSG